MSILTENILFVLYDINNLIAQSFRNLFCNITTTTKTIN